MKVSCDKKYSCKHLYDCGGCKPHEHDGGSECGNCHFDPEAKCIPIEDFTCENCNFKEPSQGGFCYMFENKPEGECKRWTKKEVGK